jgi:hypothetical protein
MYKVVFGIYFVIMVLLGALLAVQVLAAPPPGTDMNSPTSRWFQSLVDPSTGASCCSESDCRPAEERQTATGWQAKTTTGEWVDVPPEKILIRADNPLGVAVLCWRPGHVYCFIRPTEG